MLDSGAEVGLGCRLGGGVSVGARSVLMQNSVLFDGAVIGAGCYIGRSSHIGYFARIGQDSCLVSDVSVQDGVSLPDGTLLHAFASVTREGVLTDNDRLLAAVARMQGQLQYTQLASFTSIEGARCIRAQIDGVWTPSHRVSAADAQAFTTGQLGMKDLADRYIAPGYIMARIESEARTAAMKR